MSLSRLLAHSRLRTCLALFLLLAPTASSPAQSFSFRDGMTGFNAIRAYQHVKRFVAFGPHPPGSEASREVQAYLRTQLEAAGLRVEVQEFTAQTPVGELQMANVIGVLDGDSPASIILACHYDTKLFTEFTFVGANDGGSGVGVVLELARKLARKPRRLTLKFVFFDGEEALRRFSSEDGLYGSRHFVRAATAEAGLATIGAVIVVDLVGDRDLNLLREGFSTPTLLELALASARRLHLEAFFAGSSSRILDDHVPFLEAGIAALDLIDFTYGATTQPGPFWHTAEDTLDKLSVKSLKVVGDLVLETLPAIERFVGEQLAVDATSP